MGRSENTPLDDAHVLLLRQTILDLDQAHRNGATINNCEGGSNIMVPNHTPACRGFPAIATYIHVSFTN